MGGATAGHITQEELGGKVVNWGLLLLLTHRLLKLDFYLTITLTMHCYLLNRLLVKAILVAGVAVERE